MSGENTSFAVVIVGGGPTGMMLAGELALTGVRVALVERLERREFGGSRAGGLHARTLEVLGQRGIVERFIAAGQKAQVAHFHVALDMSDFPTRHNYGLALWQQQTERLLAEWIGTVPVSIYNGREVTGFSQHETGVDVTLSDATSLRAEYLVGCDGARSLIRKTAGIEFPGWDPSVSWLMAEAATTEEPRWGFHRDAIGIHAIGKGDGGTVRMVLAEREVGTDRERSLDDVRKALQDAYGTDFGVHDPTWITRFTDMTRQAATYRDRRVLLAGDAAHMHAPLGGQGLNIGVQDAVNLGWKLAQVVKRTSPDSLLDTYHAERHPVAARVLRLTMAQVALRRTDERTQALGEVVSELLAMEEPRVRFAAEMSGLGVRYDFGDGDRHPLVGRRIPDLDLSTDKGPLRLFTLLHEARPLLVNFEPAGFDITPWADRVRRVDARYSDSWQLPAIGTITAPPAVLVRPDGYVAWAGDRAERGLADALTTWFGPPAA